jgi:hypothetical protein
MTDFPRCKHCGKRIVFGVTDSGSHIPLDPEKGTGGRRYRLERNGHAIPLDTFDQRRMGREGHRVHFDTCAGETRFGFIGEALHPSWSEMSLQEALDHDAAMLRADLDAIFGGAA